MTRFDRPTLPPTHLEPATQKWFSAILQTFQLEEHHLRLLQLAAEAWDRAQQAREAIGRHGLTFEVEGVPRLRPEVRVEADSRIAFARLIRKLDLDVGSPSEIGIRPPALRSNSRGLKFHAG
jgi:hypothetical protein